MNSGFPMVDRGRSRFPDSIARSAMRSVECFSISANALDGPMFLTYGAMSHPDNTHASMMLDCVSSIASRIMAVRRSIGPPMTRRVNGPFELVDENRIRADIKKQHARNAAFLSKKDIVQTCRLVSIPGATVRTWECDGTDVTEAEDMCARMSLSDVVQLVVSEDSDVVPLNVPFTLRVIGGPMLLRTAMIREAMELTQSSIIDGVCVVRM